MPQKPVFSRAPIISVTHCFPANGTVRTTDERIERLYQKANEWVDYPCLWEGLFRIACLIKNNPCDEPVSSMILNGMNDTGNGAFSGSFKEQICIARAAFSVYEYTADRAILRRIALWLRYVEIEFESLCDEDSFLYCPADLMELLIRFYLCTGTKAVLRLCSKLRAEAFDWTTALQTFQYSIPVSSGNHKDISLQIKALPNEIDYDEKQKLVNHAEMLADGVRYTLYAGLFSGNGQDLSAGKNAWSYLQKYHHALCGGTTSGPFLCGQASDQPVGTAALSAWTEAFSAQMICPGSEWAVDEMIRTVFNGLADCLEKKSIPGSQYINTVNNDAPSTPANHSLIYARLTRAVSAAVSHAVSFTEEGLRINYFLPSRFLLMIRKQPVILQMTYDSAVFQCKSPFFVFLVIYASKYSADGIVMVRGGKQTSRRKRDSSLNTGLYLRTEGEWNNFDGFLSARNDVIICESTHHQGICFFYRNRLLSVHATKDQYAYAVSEYPVCTDDKIKIRLSLISEWKLRTGLPSDIPVLPEKGKRSIVFEMTPYYLTNSRITMFPRTGDLCLK